MPTVTNAVTLQTIQQARFLEDNIVIFQVIAAMICLALLGIACIPIRRIRQQLRVNIIEIQKKKRQAQYNDNRYEHIQRAAVKKLSIIIE